MSDNETCQQPQAHPERCGCSSRIKMSELGALMELDIREMLALPYVRAKKRAITISEAVAAAGMLDTVRLNFLLEEEARVVGVMTRRGVRYVVDWPSLEETQREVHATPREAIDAAMGVV